MGLARPAGGLASFPPSYFFFLLVSQASFPILDRNLELVRFSVGLQGYGTGAPREPSAACGIQHGQSGHGAQMPTNSGWRPMITRTPERSRRPLTPVLHQDMIQLDLLQIQPRFAVLDVVVQMYEYYYQPHQRIKFPSLQRPLY
ncbi:hypothetical protein BBK36DRAFT_1144410 [Trichoderma citrinoviride]|uniref:Uncharacterized protein n=1 Tax=Trichoderma citrinoviride TaxID=58853 RepID=A0A2T4B0W8_9HYPO|nr:hypothetical protein BBK36DRAFT_1144410 [Trichoderma citrinoviride]PTB62871.1 hypothetical protein BBK36DRAFT_1144410 [Trichoderma citrinoviride]